MHRMEKHNLEGNENKESGKVMKRDVEDFTDSIADTIYRRMDVYKDELKDRGITDEEKVNQMVQEMKRQAEQEAVLDYLGIEKEDYEQGKEEDSKYLIGFHKQEIQEVSNEVEERLHECGVSKVELEGVRERYQEMIAGAVEEMCESYPELKGYINTITVTKLPDRVYACAGPRMTENGYQTEIQVSQELFSETGLENRIERMECPNWRGESWLAGKGAEAVIKHEMGHLLHLQLIAKKDGLEIGDKDISKYREVQNKYDRNDIAASICYETIKNQNINPNELARNVSVYGAHDMGECFAEAIAEYETRSNPRPFAVEVHERYERKVKEYDNYTA